MISEHSTHGINCLQSCRMEQRCCFGWELLSVLLLLECFVTPLLSMFSIPYEIWNTLETIVTVLEGFICDCCHSNGSFACSTCYCECATAVYLHILECRPWLNTPISGCFMMCEIQTFSPSDEEVRRRGYISLGYWLSSPCIVVLLCSHSVEKPSSTEIGPSGNKGNRGSNRGHSRMMKQGKLH
jgi:hypothetical protein